MRENLYEWLSWVDDQNYSSDTHVINFIQHHIMSNLFSGIENKNNEKEYFIPDVIGITHINRNLPYPVEETKNILLPIFEIDLVKLKLNIILSTDLYNWYISVESQHDVEYDFSGLFNSFNKKFEGNPFEGFPSNKIYKEYSKDNKKKFSVAFNNEYEVYTFILILRAWSIREYNLK